jgi:hypothetical protein
MFQNTWSYSGNLLVSREVILFFFSGITYKYNFKADLDQLIFLFSLIIVENNFLENKKWFDYITRQNQFLYRRT